MPAPKKTTNKKAAPRKTSSTAKAKKASPAKSQPSKPMKVAFHSKGSNGGEHREPFFWGIVGYAVMVTLILAVHIFFGGAAPSGGMSAVRSGTPFAEGEGEKGYYFDGENTWIAVPGNPVELFVLNDPACGQACDPSQGIDRLKQNITEALVVQELDVNTAQGKAMAEKFNLLSVPAFVLGEGFENLELDGGVKPKDSLAAILQKEGNQYLIQSSAIGLKPGQYIKDIPFADLDSEPTAGSGKVRVVEFTDYQCPFCKRLYDNNRALIDQFIAEGKIEYIIKDFPLSIHPEATAMHAAANCALEAGGQEAFENMKDFIFQAQSSFSRIGIPAAQDRLISKAAEWGYDEASFRSCVTSSEVQDEIRADMQEGQQYGVTGTPALFIGKQLIPGAIGPDQFRAAVESQL